MTNTVGDFVVEIECEPWFSSDNTECLDVVIATEMLTVAAADRRHCRNHNRHHCYHNVYHSRRSLVLSAGTKRGPGGVKPPEVPLRAHSIGNFWVAN